MLELNSFLFQLQAVDKEDYTHAEEGKIQSGRFPIDVWRWSVENFERAYISEGSLIGWETSQTEMGFQFTGEHSKIAIAFT